LTGFSGDVIVVIRGCRLTPLLSIILYREAEEELERTAGDRRNNDVMI
jgi:hypothetical protein